MEKKTGKTSLRTVFRDTRNREKLRNVRHHFVRNDITGQINKLQKILKGINFSLPNALVFCEEQATAHGRTSANPQYFASVLSKGFNRRNLAFGKQTNYYSEVQTQWEVRKRHRHYTTIL